MKAYNHSTPSIVQVDKCYIIEFCTYYDGSLVRHVLELGDIHAMRDFIESLTYDYDNHVKHSSFDSLK